MLPDWTKEGDYPEDPPMEGWAWEFLRRNDEYESSWLEYRDIAAKLLAKFGPEESWSAQVRMGTEVWHFDPPIKPGESQIDWRRRVLATGHEPGGPETFSRAMAREWELLDMQDPSVSAFDVIPRFLQRRPQISFYVGDIEEDTYSAPPISPGLPSQFNVAVVQVDMTRQLRPQMDYVLDSLENKRDQLVAMGALLPPMKRGPKPKYYRDILRVFDAYAVKEEQNITNKAIADKLGVKDEKLIGEKYATARRYVIDKGYRSLIP